MAETRVNAFIRKTVMSFSSQLNENDVGAEHGIRLRYKREITTIDEYDNITVGRNKKLHPSKLLNICGVPWNWLFLSL